MRLLNYSILILFFLLNIAGMMFGLGMEGMRHSLPNRNTFDPYYVECCAPAIHSSILLGTAFIRLGRISATAIAIMMSLLAAGFCFYLMKSYSISSGIFAAVFLSVPILAWNQIQKA